VTPADVPDELVANAVDAWHAAGDMLLDDVLREVLAVVLPEIQAQALRDHAERRNRVQYTHSCFKPVCASCREVRLRQEERASLLRAAARLTTTTEGTTA
jgi:hypothetical protein